MITRTKKEVAELWLRDVAHDKMFWFHDGRMVKNLDQLATTLREMLEEMFHYHATGDKNDFGSWVRDVVGDLTLANQLQTATTQATAARRVEARLNWVRAKL
jgi:hypothetical protein